MILTPDNEQLLLYAHWFRLVRPEHIARLGLNDLEYLYTRMPEMAKAGYLNRVTWRRQRINDIYAAYELGVQGRNILRDSFGISKNATRFKQTPKETNFSWIHHTLLTTDITVALRGALGEDFTPVPVGFPLKGENIHADSRVRLKIMPNFSFTLFGKLHHIEADTGHEPIMRTTLSYQQDLYRKCLVLWSSENGHKIKPPGRFFRMHWD